MSKLANIRDEFVLAKRRALEAYHRDAKFPDRHAALTTAGIMNTYIANGKPLPEPTVRVLHEMQDQYMRAYLSDMALRIMAWNYLVEKGHQTNWKELNPLIPDDYFDFVQWYDN